MKTKPRIQHLGLAAILLAVPVSAVPKHPAPKNQPPKVVEAVPVEAEKPQESAEPQQPPSRQPESQIIKEVRTYETSLRDLAERAERIVQQMPDKPDELARNFGDLREVLTSARASLAAILERKSQIDAQAQTVLQSAAEVRQGFVDLNKKIEDRLQQIRQKETDNPKAVEAAAKALEGIKVACKNGESAVGPLRQLVLETHRQGQAVFAELELYPQIFDYAIETCDLYQKGIGEPVSYAAVIEGLTKARSNLRAIIDTFMQAAQKAEETIKKLPQPMAIPPIS